MTSNPEPCDQDPFRLADDAAGPGCDTLAPGTRLDRYEITRLIGRGGMGCVYEALHRDLNKRVAIKTLVPALATSPEARRRFLREGQAASRIRHPHVVDVTDVVADGPRSYLVMEYLEGEDLSALIARRGCLSLAETADIMLPVLAAIGEAHGQGVVHRDLKPENIFLARASYGGASPKVLDFGISKVLDDPPALALTGTSVAFGTVHYLPPEQLRGAREADARSDQYALGTILYECLTGSRAFDGDNIYAILKSVAEGDYLAPRTLRPDLPEPIGVAIGRAMSVDPASRFASVRELGAALVGVASPSVATLWASAFVPAPREAPPAIADADAAAAPAGTRTLILPASTSASASASTSTSASASSAFDVLPRQPPSLFTVILLAAAAVGVALVAAANHSRRNMPPAGAIPRVGPRSPGGGAGDREPSGVAGRLSPPPPAPGASSPFPPPARAPSHPTTPGAAVPRPKHGKRRHLRSPRPAPLPLSVWRTSAPIIDD